MSDSGKKTASKARRQRASAQRNEEKKAEAEEEEEEINTLIWAQNRQHSDGEAVAPDDGIAFKNAPVVCKICTARFYTEEEAFVRCNNSACQRPTYFHQDCLDERMQEAATVKMRCRGCSQTTQFSVSAWKLSIAEWVITVLGLMALSYAPYFVLFFTFVPEKFEWPPRASHIAFSWMIIVTISIIKSAVSLCLRCCTAPARSWLRCCRRSKTAGGYNVDVY